MIKFSDDDLLNIKNLYENKQSANDIAKLYNTNSNVILRSLKKIGVEIRSCSESKKLSIEKTQNTNLERYGVTCTLHAPEIKKKKEETFLKKYNSKNPSSNSEIKEKRRKTIQEKFGVDNVFQNEYIKDKIKETNIINYGVDNPSKSPEVQERMKKTFMKNLGVDNPLKDQRVREKISITNKNKFISKYLDYLLSIGLEPIDSYTGSKDKIKFKCTKCGHEFEQIWNMIQQRYGCPNCSKPEAEYRSSSEKDIADFINDMDFRNVSFNNRSLISPFELDIVIHDVKTAIEFCGLYWHSEMVLQSTKKQDPKMYHHNKRILCNDIGYRLITIFEDEWIFNKDLVKEKIKNILGKNDSIRIHGRSCEIKEISSTLKNNFLNNFHIQGTDNSTIRLGAFYNNNLIAIMTFSYGSVAKGSKSECDVYELNRFCTDYNYHIPGIASKLLEYFKRNYKWKKIYSYCDLRWSEGNVYKKIGFTTDDKVRLNYWYVKGLRRIHRFSLRKRSNDPKDISEAIIRYNEGYNRIWDCGNLKFEMVNKNY